MIELWLVGVIIAVLVVILVLILFSIYTIVPADYADVVIRGGKGDNGGINETENSG